MFRIFFFHLKQADDCNHKMAIIGHSGGPGVWPQVAGAPTSKDPKKLEKSKHKFMFDEKHHLCSGGNESLEVGRMLIAALI